MRCSLKLRAVNNFYYCRSNNYYHLVKQLQAVNNFYYCRYPDLSRIELQLRAVYILQSEAAASGRRDERASGPGGYRKERTGQLALRSEGEARGLRGLPSALGRTAD